jgi:hypothetical protein
MYMWTGLAAAWFALGVTLEREPSAMAILMASVSVGVALLMWWAAEKIKP